MNNAYLALEASAGSGKTFALSLRYIELVLNGANIKQILALTFTKKAANEMKGRIIQTFLSLCELEYDEKTAVIADKICTDLVISRDELLRRCEKRKAEFLKSELKISTFDSFFSSILKSFSLNCGIDPNFQISSKITALSNKNFEKEICKNKFLLEDLTQYMVYSGDMSLEKFSKNLQEFSLKNLKFEFADQIQMPNLDKINALLEILRLKFLDQISSLKENIDKHTNTVNTKFAPINDVKKLLKETWISKENIGDFRDFKKIYSPNLGVDSVFYDLKEAIKEYIFEIEKFRLKKLNDYIKLYERAKNTAIKKLNALRFDDVTQNVYRLLRENNLDKNLLYFRLDARITHLLIDEFQDTSAIQYEIMYPLIDEIVSGLGQHGLGSFFYVGDKKQSIYSFRGGLSGLFDKLKSDFSQIKTDSLSRNFRSLKLLTQFVNHVFKDEIFGYEEQECQNSAKNIDEANARKYIVQNPNFTLFNVDEDSFGYIKSFQATDVLQSATQEVKRLIEMGVNTDEIAILCWTNKDVAILKEILQTCGINSVGVNKKPLTQCANVAGILEFVKYKLSGEEIYKKNLNALIEISQNIFNIQVDLSKNALQTAKFISEILNLQMDENLLLFFEVVKGYKNLIEYLFSDDETEAFAKSGDGVKVMTVHQSKGLQFRHVILCDKNGMKPQNTSELIAKFDINTLRWDVKYAISKREVVDKEYENFKQQIEIDEKKEDINKLYVAFTRAEESLILVKQAQPNGKNPSFLQAYISDKKPVKYLDIGDFEYGYITKSKPSEAKILSSKSIVLKKIGIQDVLSVEKNLEENTNFESLKFGEALHYALEMCENFDEISIQTAIQSVKNRYFKFLNDVSLKKIEKCVQTLFASPEFRGLIDGGEIYKEISFKIDENLKRIDLLVKKDKEILIFDYKSSKNYEKNNISQVEFYKNAMTKFYPNSEIKGYILYLSENNTEILEV